ncbi:MerR family transcriptional regulator (plasmid) [Streptomyces sp. BI20]|uniref:MerR family transcriptional regulator n=1 Tax=Streptomyces sp. BI20 TaxID=3403460 RepID=UPI003C729E15
MTIGHFAKATRLSPKALRLYDELGLLRPARVDPVTGYRLYAPAQVERARLVAWLRRLGMPLAEIRGVCDLDAAGAAAEVRAYWARVEAETAARRDLASFLVDHLSRKDTLVSTPELTPLTLRYAALSDRGLVREHHQDTAHAGSRLFAVADGHGRAGARASAAAVDALRHLDTEEPPAGHLLDLLQDAADRAREAVHEAVGAGDADGGASGTTLSAMLWTGSRLALVHIGDSRVHLLRDGELFLLTHDHTHVRALVDEGRISAAEAESHPRRALLTRALGPGVDNTPDLRLHEPRAGDRWLLCSDGLSTVVPDAGIRRVLTEVREPAAAVRALVDLANSLGGPDNIGCVVADVIPTPETAA